jgi:hypothetical protein
MRDRNELQFQFWGVRITARGEKAIRAALWPMIGVLGVVALVALVGR